MARKESTLSAKVIAISNEKGGVGKSSLSTTLSYLLAKQGRKVLLIDFDGQANSTMISGVENPNKLTTTISTLLDCIIEDKPLPDPESYIMHMKNNVDLIPSNSSLFALESSLVIANFREEILIQLIEELRPLYEIILIDCMPQMGTPLYNVLMCADSLIIPTQSELLSAHGLVVLLQHIKKIQKKRKTQLKIEGILINMDSANTIVSKEVIAYLESNFGQMINVFNTRIPRSTKVPEASIYQQNICEYDPTNHAAIAYEEFVKELMSNETKQTKCS